MISQVHARTINRRDCVTKDALSVGSPWVRELERILGSTVRPDRWATAVGEVAIFRDRWEITTSTDLLGPVPASYEWEQSEQRASLQRLIQSWTEDQSSSLVKGASALPAPIVRQPLIPAGPTL
ncbi:hypothetical protein NHF46_00890 [Arthrobacter alpinus]|nr:hypothetical protein [Arthrobacter alpinus]